MDPAFIPIEHGSHLSTPVRMPAQNHAIQIGGGNAESPGEGNSVENDRVLNHVCEYEERAFGDAHSPTPQPKNGNSTMNQATLERVGRESRAFAHFSLIFRGFRSELPYTLIAPLEMYNLRTLNARSESLVGEGEVTISCRVSQYGAFGFARQQ